MFLCGTLTLLKEFADNFGTVDVKATKTVSAQRQNVKTSALSRLESVIISINFNVLMAVYILEAHYYVVFNVSYNV